MSTPVISGIVRDQSSYVVSENDFFINGDLKALCYRYVPQGMNVVIRPSFSVLPPCNAKDAKEVASDHKLSA